MSQLAIVIVALAFIVIVVITSITIYNWLFRRRMRQNLALFDSSRRSVQKRFRELAEVSKQFSLKEQPPFDSAAQKLHDAVRKGGIQYRTLSEEYQAFEPPLAAPSQRNLQFVAWHVHPGPYRAADRTLASFERRLEDIRQHAQAARSAIEELRAVPSAVRACVDELMSHTDTVSRRTTTLTNARVSGAPLDDAVTAHATLRARITKMDRLLRALPPDLFGEKAELALSEADRARIAEVWNALPALEHEVAELRQNSERIEQEYAQAHEQAEHMRLAQVQAAQAIGACPATDIDMQTPRGQLHQLRKEAANLNRQFEQPDADKLRPLLVDMRRTTAALTRLAHDAQELAQAAASRTTLLDENGQLLSVIAGAIKELAAHQYAIAWSEATTGQLARLRRTHDEIRATALPLLPDTLRTHVATAGTIATQAADLHERIEGVAKERAELIKLLQTAELAVGVPPWMKSVFNVQQQVDKYGERLFPQQLQVGELQIDAHQLASRLQQELPLRPEVPLPEERVAALRAQFYQLWADVRGFQGRLRQIQNQIQTLQAQDQQVRQNLAAILDKLEDLLEELGAFSGFESSGARRKLRHLRARGRDLRDQIATGTAVADLADQADDWCGACMRESRVLSQDLARELDGKHEELRDLRKAIRPSKQSWVAWNGVLPRTDSLVQQAIQFRAPPQTSSEEANALAAVIAQLSQLRDLSAAHDELANLKRIDDSLMAINEWLGRWESDCRAFSSQTEDRSVRSAVDAERSRIAKQAKRLRDVHRKSPLGYADLEAQYSQLMPRTGAVISVNRSYSVRVEQAMLPHPHYDFHLVQH